MSEIVQILVFLALICWNFPPTSSDPNRFFETFISLEFIKETNAKATQSSQVAGKIMFI